MISRILFFASFAFLGGCSVFGDNKFQCPANLDGATCMSAREIYSATHVSDRVAPNYKDGKPIAPPSGQPGSASGGYATPEYLGSSDDSRASAGGVDKYRPPLPEVDLPLPVRVPAKVMRIRIFPWEDNARDLNAGSVVFTEVEGRTWTLGEEQTSRVQANVINPLAPPRGSQSSSSTYQSPLSAPPPSAGKSDDRTTRSQPPSNQPGR